MYVVHSENYLRISQYFEKWKTIDISMIPSEQLTAGLAVSIRSAKLLTLSDSGEY